MPKPKYHHTSLFILLSLAFAPVWADGTDMPVQAASEAGSSIQADAGGKPDKQKKENILSRAVKKAGSLMKTADPAEEAEQAELEPKYPVTVESDNRETKELMETHLPLIQYQKKEELDAEQIGYLVEETPENARNLLKTEGYFNSKVQVNPQGNGYIVRADLGERTHIKNVDVSLGGSILNDSDLGSYYQDALSGWKLPVGSPFRQEDWTASKASVLSALARKKYPLAKFTETRATVNPANHQADLSVQIDSGKPVYFGELHISGNSRYPLRVVEGLAAFKSGDPYDLDKLLDYQQALENNSHYSGASVQADFDGLQGDRVPVRVAVSEVKRQKFEAGLRFDSEYGLGGSIGYDHYNLFNRGYTGSVFVEADRYQTTVGAGISQPRNNKGNFFTSNLSYNRSTTQKLEKRGLSGGVWHVRDRGDTEIRYGLEFIAEDSKVPDSRIILGKSHATMLTASWKRQNIETQMRPANGYYADAKIGTTLGKLMSSAMTARAKVSAGYYFTPQNRRIGTFAVRGNMGYVYTNEKEANGEVPSGLMFRTGGASTVRGYELDSIGRKTPDSKAVLPDRAMAVLSAEYQYPIKESFALAVFHDMGGAARTFKHMDWKHGSGLGLRWFSPVAPFSFDVAYGHQDKKIRWHISLGTRF